MISFHWKRKDELNCPTIWYVEFLLIGVLMKIKLMLKNVQFYLKCMTQKEGVVMTTL